MPLGADSSRVTDTNKGSVSDLGGHMNLTSPLASFGAKVTVQGQGETHLKGTEAA